MELPKLYDFKSVEKKWQKYWEEKKIYKFNPKLKKPIYSIDTPPPTVSGRMHIGHAFSYSQQDFIVRYHRMTGKNVFYPFGTDDNGLPTERMVEKLKNVKSSSMSRKDFIELCIKTLNEIKPAFIQDWKNIGMSCDFDTTYSTIDKHCIKTSQKSFIDLYKKDLVYSQEAPSMWCVNCQTAIAQAELEDKSQDSLFNYIKFKLEDGKPILIGTTRPELLPACVAIFVNPSDKKNKNLIGKKAIVPIFNQEVSILADKSADPEKGTGILMICSYGDKYDVESIMRHKLQPRICFTKDGRLNELANEFKGLKIIEARNKILEKLKEENLLQKQDKITHNVNIHDKCGTEIEFLASKQWFIKILKNKKLFLDAGKKINWYPSSMFSRYKNWVQGLDWDWCISRQRHFGVPFPIWYCSKCNEIYIADEKDLPVDPISDKPKKKCKCGCSSFEPETDVMDTWATSSVSPQIALNWVKDKGYDIDFEKVYPMTLRPQAHDIIRTWAFYTIIKGLYNNNEIPWKNLMISGHIQDSKGRKMSKSLGNVIDPLDILNKYGADALRFLSSSSKLGDDIPYQEKELVAGQKIITKLWNAFKFVIMNLEDFDGKKPKELELIDKWVLIKLDNLVKECTIDFEEYSYLKPKQKIENFFWHTFCDNYLEIVKDRLYNPDKRGVNSRKSAQYVLYTSFLTIIKLIAPIMPHITEELYELYFKKFDKKESIHISDWPKELNIKDDKLERSGEEFIDTISNIRKFKNENNKSLKEPVKLIINKDLEIFLDDLKAVTNATEIKFGKFKVEF